MTLSRLIRRMRGTDTSLPKGYVLVPITPTLAMVRAGHDHTREGVTGVWAAMIQAAPSQSLK